MDVICISSDSDNSTPLNELDNQETSSLGTTYNNDVTLAVDWKCNFPTNVSNLQSENFEVNVPFEAQQSIKQKHATMINDLSIVQNDNTCNRSGVHSGLTKLKNNLEQKQKKNVKTFNEDKKLLKQKLRDEKKAEKEIQKALKTVFTENQRNLKPEENIKFLKVHIDNEIINSLYGGNIISLLQQNNIKFVVEAQLKNSVIIWSKESVKKDIDDFGNLIDKLEWKEEREMLYIMNWEKAVQLIHNNELISHIQVIVSAYVDKKLTIIIYGLREYFEIIKNVKTNQKNKITKSSQSKNTYNDAPIITKDQLEFALTELQLLGKHNYRLFENPEEVSGLVLNVTKSLSQLDFKLDKQKRQEEDFEWFAKGDSNQGAKISKDGIGLINLWQKQICQFSSVGVDTAQAIVSQYNSPVALVSKYNQCESCTEGELLLQNIQIRRNAGLLSSTRRVGPQLSKKIYKFFTSDDPSMEL